jgi:hypothetical protein
LQRFSNGRRSLRGAGEAVPDTSGIGLTPRPRWHLSDQLVQQQLRETPNTA